MPTATAPHARNPIPQKPRALRARDQRAARAVIPTSNSAESPLAWLRRRKDKDGLPMIDAAQYDAGEKLRADFTFAQLTPSVTSRWSPIGASDGSRRCAPGAGVELRDSVLAARDRVHLALAAVGPELAGILIDVCCHLKGLEDAERARGWPLRSAKVVLQIALTRLARHHGLPSATEPDARRAPRIRHWGVDDYKPALGGNNG